MASFSGHTGHEGIINKVYVNPNFKRSMHVNPNFSNKQINQFHDNKNKIFINPNFIRLPNSYESQINKFPIYHTERTVEAVNILRDKSVPNRTVTRNQTVPQFSVSNSRYALVRHKDNNQALLTQPPKTVQTVKVNKYKTVLLSDVKKTLETTKKCEKLTSKLINNPITESNHADCRTVKHLNNLSERADKSRYEIIKRNKYYVRHASSVAINTFYKKNNSVAQLSQKHGKIKQDRKLLKKNNVPCPLFRKYGKCLRNIHGNCGFLHDKKHVTVCRMFIKGMCHNNQCLLSHDLTVQKMPTCYFFLKGMCTKDGCPYLHVKLNEKAKICADFLKGYCEKGDNCMDKHVNICPNFASKGTCLNKQCPYPHKRNKLVKSKEIKVKILSERRKSKKSKIKESDTKCCRKGLDKEITDCRYYKDLMDDASASDVANKIKPIRCKLGTLPSFIEL